MSATIISEILNQDESVEEIGREEIKDKFANSISELLDQTHATSPMTEQALNNILISRIEDRIPSMWTVIQSNGYTYLSADNGNSIISLSQRRVETPIAKIHQYLEELNEPKDEDDYKWDLIDGRQFAEYLSQDLCTQVIDREDPDNLEMLVIDHIQSSVSPAIDTNVSMKFDFDGVTESSEYDILLHLSPDSRMYIECKDATHDAALLDKSDVITTPLENADRIRRYTAENPVLSRRSHRTEVVVIVRGMDDRRFSDLSQVGANRNVTLLKFDKKGNYTDAITEVTVKLAAEQSVTI
jgi:hypothetical protein